MCSPIWENKYNERIKSSTCSYNFLKLFTSKREYLTPFVCLCLCVCLQNPAGVNGFTMPTYVCVYQKGEYVKCGLFLQLFLSDPGVVSEPERPTIYITVGQGPIALAVGAGGGRLDIFTLIYPFSPLSPSLWEAARYRLKYYLKGPLNPK